MENLDPLGKYAPYFAAGSPLPPVELARKFAEDLHNKIDELRDDILRNGAPTETHAKNTLRSSIKNIKFNGKPFFKDAGQCRGACEWFAALFLGFKKKYPNVPTETILSGISKEFENGVGIQAAFLQHKAVGERKALLKGVNLELGEETEWDLSRKDLSEQNFGPERYEPIVKKLLEVRDGVYLLNFSGSNREEEIPGHATLIIKDAGRYYPFDPNSLVNSKNCETNSLISSLFLCRAYSPYMRAMHRFNEGFDQIPNVINPEDVEEFQHYVKACQVKDQAFIVCANLLGIFIEFEKQGKSYPKEFKDKIYFNLCFLPSAWQLNLEYDYRITLQKLQSVQS